ncbi:MAG: hypothetical protein RL076_1648 [Chloroflexota bacterium]|jgi:hypothetical protein
MTMRSREVVLWHIRIDMHAVVLHLWCRLL